MNAVLKVMRPGRLYLLDEILELMGNDGYRITNRSTIVSSLAKLRDRGSVVKIFTDVYMIPVSVTDSDSIRDSMMMMLASNMESGRLYHISWFSSVYIPQIGNSLPNSAVKDIVHTMVEIGLILHINIGFYRKNDHLDWFSKEKRKGSIKSHDYDFIGPFIGTELYSDEGDSSEEPSAAS